jgi:Tfp pilus assembly protein PilV
VNLSAKSRSEFGISLLETMIALTIILVVTVGIMAVAMIALQTTENQGHLLSRVAEYAQDKMEQLMSLGYRGRQLQSGLPGEYSGQRLCGLPGYRRESDHLIRSLVLHSRLANR